MSSARQPQGNGATTAASHISSPSSASPSSGFFRQRNGSGLVSSHSASSGFFDRLRRPRTATNSTTREGGASVAGGTDYGADELLDGNNSGSGFNSPSRNGATPRDRSGLPRSNSSSQVNLPSSVSPENRRPGLVSHHSSQSHSGTRFGKSSLSNGNPAAAGASSSSGQGSSLGFPLLSRSGSSQGVNNNNGANGSTGPPTSSGGFSRMFRRYSQGAGRGGAGANEARSAATGGAEAPNSASATTYDAAGPAPEPVITSTSQSQQSSSAQNSARNSHGDVPPIHTAPAPSETASTTVMANGTARATGSAAAVGGVSASPSVEPSSHRIRLVPHLEATRSLHFEPIERDLAENSVAVKIGRFTDRGQPSGGALELATGGASTVAGSAIQPTQSTVQTSSSGGIPGARGGAIPSSTGGAGRVDTGRIAFKSKVVSRGHAEIWCEGGGKVFLRDTKSSSGTFLNHIRLSAPNIESKPFQIKDGDVVQLGVDYQGGTEEIYRCVKMRVELNRGWQRGANQFNVNALRQLRALQGSPMQDAAQSGSKGKLDAAQAAALPTNRQSLNVTDCCICLFSVTVCQALFIAPCSHVFHYKCLRPLLNLHHPGFSCPLCRTFADLEADVEEDEAWQQALLKEAEAASRRDMVDQAHLEASTPMNEEPLPSLHQAMALASSNSDLDHFVDAAAAHATTPSSMHGNNDLTVHLDAAGGRARSHDSSPLSGSRRGSSNDEVLATRTPLSRRSESSHRDSPLREHSSKRPETAVSSSTVVPFATSTTESPLSRHGASRNRGSSAAGGASHDDAMDIEDSFGAARSSLTDIGRRPSGPIDISHSSTGAASPNAGPAFARHLVDGFGGSPGLSDARTPQNELFLSTLAEAPPPPTTSARSVATRSPQV